MIVLGCYEWFTYDTPILQPFGLWQLLISDWEWNNWKRCWNSGWAGVLLLLSFLYRTWQYDNILSTILSDTRLWSSPIINPGWAPAQVVQERGPTDCQHVWQTPSIPQTWRRSGTGDTLTLSTAYAVDSAELQPTNPSVELIIRSLLKTQARPSALTLGSADIFLSCQYHYSISSVRRSYFYHYIFIIHFLHKKELLLHLCTDELEKRAKLFFNVMSNVNKKRAKLCCLKDE